MLLLDLATGCPAFFRHGPYSFATPNFSGCALRQVPAIFSLQPNEIQHPLLLP